MDQLEVDTWHSIKFFYFFIFKNIFSKKKRQKNWRVADSEDEDNVDVSSKEMRSSFSGGGFASLGSLEDSLPIK
jgi:hypothetical protein